MSDISILGRIGYDLYAEEHGIPLNEVRKFSRYLGGSSANMAVALRRLGLDVGVIGCLGIDQLSRYLLNYLEKEGVETRYVRLKAGYLPSLCLTEVSPPDRFPQVFYRERAADTQVEVQDEDRQFITETKLFITNGTSLCASPSRESTYRAMEWAREAGVRVAFDVDYRAVSWTNPAEAALYARLALPLIDIFIANPQEMCLFSETEDLNQAIDRIRGQGVPMVVAKLGSEGTRVVTSKDSLFLPSYPVKTLSTIGAGDAFASGFLYALVKGMPLPEALLYGNAAAAIVVSRLMCSDAMPTLCEVQNLISRHEEIQVENA